MPAEAEAGGLGFWFEGWPVAAVEGQSLAAALAAAGHVALGTAKDGTPRGAFCGMGLCHDCLVVIDGRAGQRICLTTARDGMRVVRQPQRPDPETETLAPLATVSNAPESARATYWSSGPARQGSRQRSRHGRPEPR